MRNSRLTNNKQHQESRLTISSESVQEVVDWYLESDEDEPTKDFIQALFGSARDRDEDVFNSRIRRLSEAAQIFKERLEVELARLGEDVVSFMKHGSKDKTEVEIFKRSIIHLFLSFYASTAPSGTPDEITAQAISFVEAEDLVTLLRRYWVRYKAFRIQPAIIAWSHEQQLCNIAQRIQAILRELSDQTVDEVVEALCKIESRVNKSALKRECSIIDLTSLILRGFRVETCLFFASLFLKRNDINEAIKAVDGAIPDQLGMFLAHQHRVGNVKLVGAIFIGDEVDREVPRGELLKAIKEAGQKRLQN